MYRNKLFPGELSPRELPLRSFSCIAVSYSQGALYVSHIKSSLGGSSWIAPRGAAKREEKKLAGFDKFSGHQKISIY
jgi:hypothetical protein